MKLKINCHVLFSNFFHCKEMSGLKNCVWRDHWKMMIEDHWNVYDHGRMRARVCTYMKCMCECTYQHYNVLWGVTVPRHHRHHHSLDGTPHSCFPSSLVLSLHFCLKYRSYLTVLPHITSEAVSISLLQNPQ